MYFIFLFINLAQRPFGVFFFKNSSFGNLIVPNIRETI